MTKGDILFWLKSFPKIIFISKFDIDVIKSLLYIFYERTENSIIVNITWQWIKIPQNVKTIWWTYLFIFTHLIELKIFNNSVAYNLNLNLAFGFKTRTKKNYLMKKRLEIGIFYFI